MKKNILSAFLTIFICLIIFGIIMISLDLCGIVTLPAKFSLKTYLSNTLEVSSEGEIYYPDYEATGTTGTMNVDSPPTSSIDQSGNTSLSSIINSDSNNTSLYVTDNSFYYNQLDTYGKTIYSRLYTNLDNLKTGTYTVDFGITFNELLQSATGEQTLTDAFQLSINALLLDHPEIFYLDVTKMYMFTESTSNLRGTTYKITVGPESGSSYLSEGFNSKTDVLIAEDEINTILYSITSNLSNNIEVKIKQVHNYLIDSIEYDSTSDSDTLHSIYGALIQKRAVCDGYAKSFKFILDNLGISCVEVCGTATNSSGVTESHAWNDILLNGKWYAVDVTWDDPIILGGNDNEVLTNELRYNYYLKGSDVFYLSHYEDGYIVSNGKFDYPTLEESNY